MAGEPEGGPAGEGGLGPVVEWFDSHCHLQGRYLTGEDRRGGSPAEPPAPERVLEGVLARASEAGVTRLITVGTDAGTSAEAVALARAMGRADSPASAEGVRIWATIGLHPHDAAAGVASLDSLLAAEVDRPPSESETDRTVVGIGECGLDYHYDHSPRAAQREAFAVQVDLARRHGLALVVHTREAWGDTLDILRSSGASDRTVIHCFTGGPDEARRCLELGATLSFSGVVTFKNAADVREAAALCPLDRLLVETDSPFLAPVPHRGSTNEPSRVPLVGAAVAASRGIASTVVAEAATRNTCRVFGL